MKESALFLNYFKKNTVLILIPTLIVAAAFYYFQWRQPYINLNSRLYILEYDQNNIEKAALLTDSFVSIIRNAHLKEEIGINRESKVIAYRSGPLTIDITLANLDENQSRLDSEILEGYLKKYPINRIGSELSYVKKRAEWILAIIGLGIGFILGNILSLIKIYLSKY